MANPWERDWGSSGQVIPKSDTTVRKEGADASSAEADARLKSAQAEYAAQLARAQAREAEAAAALKMSQAGKEAVETAALPTPPTPEVKSARNELATDAIIEKLNTARRQIGEGWSTGNFAGGEFFQGIPWAGQNSADLAATLEGITGSLINDTLKDFRAQSATGASGFGSLTEREASRLAAAVASMRQTQSEESLLANLALVEKHYRNLMALKNNEDPRDPAVADRYGIAVAAPPQNGGPGTGLAGDGSIRNLPPPPSGGPDETTMTAAGQMVTDPALAGANAAVSRMIREGRPEEEIRAYLNRLSPGLGDRTDNLGANIQYYNQNPNFSPQIDIEKVWQPASGLSQAMGEFGMSPLGTGIIGAGDMFSFGTMDNFAQNPDMARAVVQGVQERNPGSFLAGQVAGGVLSGIGAEAALGRVGLGNIARMRGGDISLGAGYGAGSADDPNDSRLGGAAAGGLFGLAGGMAGRGGARALGTAVRGVADPARRMLAERGVPQTVGQILGGATQRVEDRLSGLPLIGDQIMARRREGVQAFNRAAFDEALAPIRETAGDMVAEAGIGQVQNMVSDAYRNALSGAQVTADPGFVQNLSQSIAGLRSVPRVGEEVVSTLDDMLPPYFGPGGTLTGENMQPLLRGLGQVRRAYQVDPLAHRVGQGIEGVEGAIEGMFERQAPDVLPAYRAANEAFRNEEVLRAAVNAARNGSRSGEPGVFMPSQLADAAAANSRRFGNSAGTTRQPFFDLSRAGQEVLPSQIPDSGTAGRLTLPGVAFLLGGGGGAAVEDGGVGERAGSGLATGVTAAALAAAPYSAGARNAVARALLSDRNPTVQRIGEEIIERNRIAGLLATAPLLAATQGQ